MSVDEPETIPEWLSLDPDEEVVWVGQPAFETLYGTIATGVVFTVVLIGFLILLGVPFSYLRIQNTDYVVTTKSLYVKRGIFSTNIETVDLDRIQNTEYNQSFWGRQFGYGRIAISTAGSSGAEITFSGIPDAKAVRDRITELQARHTGRADDGTGGRPTGEPAPDTAAKLDELVAEMRATREAFERLERALGEGDGPDEPARGGASEGIGSQTGSAAPEDGTPDGDADETGDAATESDRRD